MRASKTDFFWCGFLSERRKREDKDLLYKISKEARFLRLEKEKGIMHSVISMICCLSRINFRFHCLVLWTGEPGRLQSMWLQRVIHKLATTQIIKIHTNMNSDGYLQVVDFGCFLFICIFFFSVTNTYERDRLKK